MYLLSSKMMGQVDRYAIDTLHISSLTLMKRAGDSVAEEILKMNLSHCPHVYVFCGKGNNGGDGFVIAKKLWEAKLAVTVILAHEPAVFSPDAQAVREELYATSVSIVSFAEMKSNQPPQKDDIIIDALLGTGMQGALKPIYEELITYINALPCQIIAVDIPSGIHATTGEICSCCVHAQLTVTFCCEKYAHRLFPAKAYCGKVVLKDIGIPKEAVDSVCPTVSLITEEQIDRLFPKRMANAHKGTYGRILLIGGSVAMSGAIVMATKACLRSGGGLVTAAVPSCIAPIVATKTLESMTVSLPCKEGAFSKEAIPLLLSLASKSDCVAIGCGMTTTKDTSLLVASLIAQCTCPLIIDADGINAVAQNPDMLKKAACPITLTPHNGEMARLLRMPIAYIQENRFTAAQTFAKDYGVTLVLKGPYSVVATKDGSTFVNTTGNNGMATGGSGDVLTGIIAAFTSFAAFLKSPQTGAVAGVYIHGKAGDLAAQKLSQYGMTAGDIIENLPFPLKKFDLWE